MSAIRMTLACEEIKLLQLDVIFIRVVYFASNQLFQITVYV